MNSDWMTTITNICQDLLTSKSDVFVTFGLNIVTGLAVIRLVLFGISSALHVLPTDRNRHVGHSPLRTE